jgi:integrase
VSSHPAGLLPRSQDYQALQVTRISLVRRAFQGAQSELSGNENVGGRGTGREPEIAGESIYTDDGQVHEHRGLKGRTKGRPGPRARRPVRKVPIPPELVELLRAHLAAFGVAPDGRLFRSENGNPLQPSTWWQVWQKVRAASLTPDQLASPLMKRPYDLRHSGVTWRLNSGVPATEVAAWAGHSVEVLTRVYARCVVGLEGVWIGRMDEALHLGEDR